MADEVRCLVRLHRAVSYWMPDLDDFEMTAKHRRTRKTCGNVPRESYVIIPELQIQQERFKTSGVKRRKPG